MTTLVVKNEHTCHNPQEWNVVLYLWGSKSLWRWWLRSVVRDQIHKLALWVWNLQNLTTIASNTAPHRCRVINELDLIIFLQIQVPARDKVISIISIKIYAPNSVFDFKWTPILERCMVGCQSKNGHHKNMYWKMIGLHAQNLLTILNTIVNMCRGDFYDHLLT